AEVLQAGAGPAAEDAVVEVPWARVAAAARVVLVAEVRRRWSHELRARALAVAGRPVTADASLEEHLLAAQEVLLRDGEGVARQPVAAVDLGEIRRLLELPGRHRYVGALRDLRLRALEALGRGLEALVRQHDVLRVELARVA